VKAINGRRKIEVEERELHCIFSLWTYMSVKTKIRIRVLLSFSLSQELFFYFFK
jgi:hypothetical protein